MQHAGRTHRGESPKRRARTGVLGILGLFGLLASGCQQPEPLQPVVIHQQAFGPMRIAVAPALNFSGGADFDPNAVAEIMASELSNVEGWQVLPVSRVVAVLLRQGVSRIESPAHALAIAEAIGADGILVFGVTEYDPYDPPVVGLAAQLYVRMRGETQAFDPVHIARSAAPAPQQTLDASVEPAASYSGVYNASADAVIHAVKRFAEARDSEASPFGWRKYVASQRHYLRFCCHATINELVGAGRPIGVSTEKDRQVGRP